MGDEEQEGHAELKPVGQPALRLEPHPAPQGVDWNVLWNGVKNLILGGKKLGGQLEATTQTQADDVIVGKIGIITANVAPGKAGEIRLPVRGGTQDYIACAQAGLTETMEVNSTAEVVVFAPPNTVYVRPRASA